MIVLNHFQGRASRSFLAFVAFALSFLYSCCRMPYEQGSLQPEWETVIPTGTSGEIFYDGLPNMPKSGDLVIAHTTVRDEGFWAEDNRLCAINVNSGEISWYYPANLNEKHYAHFDAKGYSYSGKIVFQYAKNYKDDSSKWKITSLCLNAENGLIIWEIDGETPNSRRPSVGRKNDCFFSPDSCSVYKVDLNTDQIIDFYHTVSNDIYITDIALFDNYLVLSCCSDSVEEYQLETYVFIIDATTGQEVFNSYLGRCSVPPHCLLEKNILYANVETYLTAIDIRTGQRLWERDDRWAYTLFDMYIYKDVLLKCAGNATVGYDKVTGKILYDYRDYGSYYTTLEGQYAYLVNRRNEIDIIDVETGTKLDKIVCPYGEIGFFGSYPAIYDNKMYVMGENRLFRYPTYPWH